MNEKKTIDEVVYHIDYSIFLIGDDEHNGILIII